MTAVEWLVEQLAKNGILHSSDIAKAKEMEKEQIMNDWNNGFEENRPYVDHSEDYYNETFKSE